MAVLHIVNKPAALPSCLDAASAEDVVLLIEDGVYAATQKTSRTLRVLDLDAQARGVASRLSENTTLASYEDFVRLTEQHTPIVTWC